ncbi:unknown [Alistipes sp. CAG:53]|nr:unknown [Alistipes sp. CAG:53]
MFLQSFAVMNLQLSFKIGIHIILFYDLDIFIVHL